MFTSSLIRFLDRLVVADKCFAVVADQETIRFFSAFDGEARYPDAAGEIGAGALLLRPAAGSALAANLPHGIAIPAEIERSGVEAIEALAYDQALICSCSLARADLAPFEEDFLLDDEREATRSAARIYRDTLLEAKPDEEPDDIRVLLRYAKEKPAELSPMTLLVRLLEAGAPRVLLFQTPDTGTIVGALDDSVESSGVFADYSEAPDLFGARVSGPGLAGELYAGYAVAGRTVRVFCAESIVKSSRSGMLTGEALLSFLR